MSDSALHPNGVEKPQRKRRGLKWFCVDLWWVHVIVVIVVTLVVSLPMVYVGYPNIAQSDINKAKLNITRMSITQPRPDGFTLNLTTELETHSKFRPELRAWNGTLFLAGANESYLSLEIPGFQARNGHLTDINTVVTLSDSQLEPFGDYVSTMVAESTVTSFLIGKGNLKLGALPTISIKYNKTLTMGGFDGLKGVEIADAKLLTTPQPDNATLAGKVHIPNNSGGTVELGNLTFGLSLAADVLKTELPTPIGTATVNNTLLKPFTDNVFDLRSVANQSAVLSALQVNASYTETGVPITIVARKIEYNGQEIPWLTQALAASPIIQYLNITEIVANTGSG